MPLGLLTQLGVGYEQKRVIKDDFKALGLGNLRELCSHEQTWGVLMWIANWAGVMVNLHSPLDWIPNHPGNTHLSGHVCEGISREVYYRERPTLNVVEPLRGLESQT